MEDGSFNITEMGTQTGGESVLDLEDLSEVLTLTSV